LLACGAPSSGSWLGTLPTASLGLRLLDSEVRIAIGLRLGAPIMEKHNCTCGMEVLPNGHHGLSCRRGPGRQSRHDAVNEIIARTLRKRNPLFYIFLKLEDKIRVLNYRSIDYFRSNISTFSQTHNSEMHFSDIWPCLGCISLSCICCYLCLFHI